MRNLWISFAAGSAAVVAISLIASSSHSQPRPAEPELKVVAEPTIGPPIEPSIEPSAGSERRRSPFGPHDPGPPEAVWTYDQLGADERAVADRGRAVAGWAASHAAYRDAVARQAAQGKAAAAAQQLGISHLAIIGVVR